MPKLKHFWITVLADPLHDHVLCAVIDCVASQGKTVVVSVWNNWMDERYWKLKVERKKSYELVESSGETIQTFNIFACLAGYPLELIFKTVNKFLNKYRKDHCAYICDVNSLSRVAFPHHNHIRT